MKLGDLIPRFLKPRNSYSDLEERAFSDRLRQANVSGQVVTEHSALWQSAVWGCVRVISETLAMLPMDVIERRGERRDTLGDHPVAWLLNTSPDGVMPAFRLRETMLAHALIWGNGYAEIERDTVGRPYALHLLTPDRTVPQRTRDGVVFRHHQADGTFVDIPGRDVLHIPGLSYDGLQGYSIAVMAAQSLGLNAAVETFASAFFGNNMQLGTVYTTEQTMKEETAAFLREQLEKLHRGAAKAFRAALLTHGLKPSEPPMALSDAQFVESRRFGVLEICRWFRVPPHLVMELERATHSNVEQEQLAFVTHCLQPWATRIESECNLKLFGRNQQSRQTVKHNFGALLRGDLKSRYEAYRIARETGTLNANEIRALEERNPIPDGDVYLVPANMTTLEKLQEPSPSPVVTSTPEPAPSDPSPEPSPTDQLESARRHMHLVRSTHA